MNRQRNTLPQPAATLSAPTVVPRAALEGADALVQECCDDIASLVEAAIACLPDESKSRCHVRRLLRLIANHADDLCNEINGLAESHGANHQSHREEARS